jgi:hypothetical protein
MDTPVEFAVLDASPDREPADAEDTPQRADVPRASERRAGHEDEQEAHGDMRDAMMGSDSVVRYAAVVDALEELGLVRSDTSFEELEALLESLAKSKQDPMQLRGRERR